jgi:hypothetical protein
MGRRTRRLTGAGTGLVALLMAAPLVLSACSDSRNSSSSTSSANDKAAVPQRVAPGSAGAAAGGSQNLSAGSGSGSGTTSGTSTSVNLAPTGRSLIITAGLQIKTDDATAAAAAAQQAAQAAGGFVAGESIGSGTQQVPNTAGSPSSGANDGSGAGSSADTGDLPSPATLPDVADADGSTQALLILRVPPDRLDAVLRALPGNGTVTYQSRTATDVTGQVADVSSRVTSAQAAIAELRALIDKAASMNDLISLEQALAQRESDLESLQAQQKALADQVQYATVTVGYFQQGQPAAPPPVRTGFMKGLTTGWHAFTTVLRGLLATLGWLVPFAVVVGVLWWPVRRLVRRSRARAPKPVPVAPDAPSTD